MDLRYPAFPDFSLGEEYLMPIGMVGIPLRGGVLCVALQEMYPFGALQLGSLPHYEVGCWWAR